ncbi:MAG: tetratricopeptide repeat protein [Candidatus Methylumidiphilus sp.]
MNRQQRRAVEKQERKGKSALLDDSLSQAIKSHKEGNLSAAEKTYRAVLKSIPQQPDACNFLGVLLHQCGRSSEAIAFINRAIVAKPNYMDAYNNLGNVYKETGDLEKAKETYRKAINLSPDHSVALNNLGVVLKDLGEFEEAIASIQKAIALEPNRADFFHNLGNAYRKQGDLKKSAEACRQSIALQPYQADAYKSLWRTLYLARDFDEAAKVLKQWLEYDPDNAIAKHTYAAHMGGEWVPERASDDYVQQTFDNFAGSFDQVLERLDYRAPSLVARAVGDIHANPANELIVLDAGCGTGLCGPLLRPYAAKLMGVDLSPKMLAKAKGREVYDELIVAELVGYLEQHQSAFDMIVSADTLVYFGELMPFMQAAKNALMPGGHLVFTLEKSEIGEDFKLNIHGRYSHVQSHVEQVLAQSGFRICLLENEVLRKESGQPVVGILVAASLST